jgi:hypothetical protein
MQTLNDAPRYGALFNSSSGMETRTYADRS